MCACAVCLCVHGHHPLSDTLEALTGLRGNLKTASHFQYALTPCQALSLPSPIPSFFFYSKIPVDPFQQLNDWSKSFGEEWGWWSPQSCPFAQVATILSPGFRVSKKRSQVGVMRDGAVLGHLPPDGVNMISNLSHSDIEIKWAPGCEAKRGGVFRLPTPFPACACWKMGNEVCLYCQRNGFHEEEKQG